MNKTNIFFIFIFFIFLIIAGFIFPVNSILYDDQDYYKDSNGDYYLSRADSYHFKNNLDNNKLESFVELYYYGFNKNYYPYIAKTLMILCSMLLFYFLLYEYDLYSAFIGTTLFYFHPINFLATAKGVIDRDVFIIFIFLTIIISLYWFKHSKFMISFIMILSLCIGFYIRPMIFYLILGTIFLFIILKYLKKYKGILIISSSIISVFLVMYYYGFNFLSVGELTPYNYLYLYDLFLIPIVFYYNFKFIDYDKNNIYFLGLFFGMIGLLFSRFMIFFIPFYSILLSKLVYYFKYTKLKNDIIKIIFFIVLLSTLVLSCNYKIIYANDSISQAMNLTSQEPNTPIMSNWQYGNIFSGLSNNKILYQGHPSRREQLSYCLNSYNITCLDNMVNEKPYFFILANKDFKDLDIKDYVGLYTFLGENMNFIYYDINDKEKFFILVFRRE